MAGSMSAVCIPFSKSICRFLSAVPDEPPPTLKSQELSITCLMSAWRNPNLYGSLNAAIHFHFFLLDDFACIQILMLLLWVQFCLWCCCFLSSQGLTYKKLNRLDEALDSFLKLHAILRNSAQVLCQIANVYLSWKLKGIINSLNWKLNINY